MGFIKNSVIGVAGVGITAAGFFALDNTGRDSSGSIVDAGEIGVFSLQVGDCLNDFPSIDELQGGLVSEGLGVPCSTPHQYEVFYETFFDKNDSVLDIESAAGDVCLEQFEGYVGASYRLSSLDFVFFIPSEESWEQGDRELTCLLTSEDGTPLAGSARNSGL